MLDFVTECAHYSKVFFPFALTFELNVLNLNHIKKVALIWQQQCLSLPDAHPLRNDTTSQKTQDHLRSNTVGSTRARTSLILAWHNILFNTQPKITWSTWLALSWLQQSWAFSYWSCLLVPWLCNSEALPPVAICFRSLWSSKKVFISASG